MSVHGAIPDAYGPDTEESARITGFGVTPTSPVSFSADGTLMPVQDDDGFLALRDSGRDVGTCFCVSMPWPQAVWSSDGSLIAAVSPPPGPRVAWHPLVE